MDSKSKLLPWPRRPSYPVEQDSSLHAAFDFDDSSPKYTSLKEILASSKTGFKYTYIDISIKHPLVKQAAFFHLQPMPTATATKHTSKKSFVRKIWEKMPQDLKQPVEVLLGFINQHVIGKATGVFRRR